MSHAERFVSILKIRTHLAFSIALRYTPVWFYCRYLGGQLCGVHAVHVLRLRTMHAMLSQPVQSENEDPRHLQTSRNYNNNNNKCNKFSQANEMNIRFQQQGSIMEDKLYGLCFPCCAAIQLEQELRIRGESDA